MLVPGQPAGMRIDLADLEGNEAVALVSDFEDLFVVRRPLQRIVRVPSTGQPIVETRTSPPFVSQLVIHEARHFWATQAGLSIDQSPVLQMPAGDGEWIPTRHGMFAVWAATGEQVTVFKLGTDGTLQALLQLPGSVPATGLGRDAIIEDDSGVWLTLKAAAATRFVRLDPDGRVAQTLEQPGAAYPIGVVGSRFYSINEQPTATKDGPPSRARPALAWRPL